jgi:Uma2 family endonuclease
MHQPTVARRTSASIQEPTWDIAQLFPAQGAWCEEEYLALNGNHLVELSNGRLEVLPMPTSLHQLIVAFLYESLSAFSRSHDLGVVLFAPLRVRLWAGKFREPDIVFMRREHADRAGDRFWKGADLVMEVVSGDEEDRRRDLVVKRQEYAKAGIGEYWIVDPRDERIIVLRLARKRYVVHGEFEKGSVASSHLLPGFTVDVTQTFARRIPGKTASKGRAKQRRRRAP